MKPQGDITKLPKWAQRDIERLQRDVAHFIEVLSTGDAESNTFADPYSAAPRPLGHDVTIEFQTTDGGRFRVKLERDRLTGKYDRLNVNGSDSIAISPGASNSVDIRVGRRS